MKRVALIQHENQPDEPLPQAVYEATRQAIIRSLPGCATLINCDDARLRSYIAQQKPEQVTTITDVSQEIAETPRDEKIVLMKLGPLAGSSTDGLTEPAFLPAAATDTGRSDSALADIVSLVTKLAWDSEFFGFGVGRVTCLRLTESIEARVRQTAADQDLRFLEFRCGSGDRLSVTTAEAHGYSLADTRVTFELKNQRANGDDSNRNLQIAVAREKDIDALVAVGSDLYRDSRYYFDGGFAEDTLRAFYGTWIRNGVLGRFDDFALALYDDGSPIGFCTVKLERGRPAAGRIGLFGLSRDHHGKGLGTAFLRASIERLAADGVTSLEVVTQGRNVSAQRLYQRAGFLTKLVELTYHKWLK